MSREWQRLLAQRAANLHGWVKIDVDVLFETPDLIYFGDGAPAREMIPADRMRQAHADAWEEAEQILSYGEAPGHEPLRELIARRMLDRGTRVSRENIIVTNGSQQGLDLIARVLFNPGDIVVVEGPTYFGALQAFDAYQVGYQVAPVDENGLIPEVLELALSAEPRPKALYTVPTFQNPTGTTISLQRREQILEITRKRNVAVIEDDPYGDLYFGPEPTPPLRSLDPDVIYLGTFSKTLAPALRMGWTVVPDDLYRYVAWSKEAVDIMSDRFVQRMVVRTASDGWLHAQLEEARAFYRLRRDWLLAALDREMPDGVTWTRPQGGFFLWVTLPEGLTSDDLLPVAVRHNVGFLPGSCFFPEPVPQRGFRLSYPTLDHPTIDEGVRRLGEAIREIL